MVLFTFVWFCLRLYGSVYVCMVLFTFVWFCLRLYGSVYVCMVLFTFVWFCLRLYGSVYVCMVLFTFVWFCLRLYGSVYVCMVLFTFACRSGFLAACLSLPVLQRRGRGSEILESGENWVSESSFTFVLSSRFSRFVHDVLSVSV